MSKLFQIYEEDLADLEQIMPRIADATMASLDNRLRTEWRRVQAIITNVRWNYGPPKDVEIIDT